MTDFRSLGVSEAVSDVLAARGIDAPFQIQALVIPEALRGGDVLAKSPTGPARRSRSRSRSCSAPAGTRRSR